ncbi:MAG: hypothetical protein COA41_17235 [Sphingopyxis sp.]|nr:MAG: hypothetical protein COA41_17235 [Sphingopyxis sp.]
MLRSIGQILRICDSVKIQQRSKIKRKIALRHHPSVIRASRFRRSRAESQINAIPNQRLLRSPP